MAADPADLVARSVETAEILLGVDSFDDLVESLLARMLLPGGRFEAHEFGQNQHASGAAGAVLMGLAGIEAIPTARLQPVATAVRGLVRDTGDLRGHDSDPDMASTSWALAQIALSLMRRQEIAALSENVLIALNRRLLSFQDQSSGGWAFREGEATQPLFAFYAGLALTRARSLGLTDPERSLAALLKTSRYLNAALEDANHGSLEERLLMARALQRIVRSSAECRIESPHARALHAAVLASAYTSGRLNLEDRSVVVYPQPTWHAVVWRPLFYLAVRGHEPPTGPLGALLGRELVSTFSRPTMSWPGPAVGVKTGSGASWASALALEATYRLARDISAIGLEASEWLARCAEIADSRYEFDVAISFAGADRAVALAISQRLKAAGFRVFYDRDFQHALLGEDLTQYLQDTYTNKSKYAVIIVSRAFLASRWAGNWEWRAVLARMQRQSASYVLPYLLEDIPVPGLNPTIGYVSEQDLPPVDFADLVIRKITEQRR